MSKKNKPDRRTALHAVEDCVSELMHRRGAIGVVVGVRFKDGTMTLHNGDLSGLSTPLRESIAESKVGTKAAP